MKVRLSFPSFTHLLWHQISPGPRPLLFPGSPIILSVFLGLRDVPKAMCFTCLCFDPLYLSSFGARKLLETCFLCSKRKPFYSLLKALNLSLTFRISLGCSPHLIPFLNPGYHPLEFCSKLIHICSAWLFLSSWYPPVLWGTDTPAVP